MDDQRSQATDQAAETADRLHSAAVHLLRRLRVEDAGTGMSASRLSAMSVIVFGGPITVGDLARAEQVRAPTMSRLVKDLERTGLVRRVPDAEDRRRQRIEATGRGRRLLHAGRARRVARLAAELATLPAADQRLLMRAAGVLERLLLPSEHPGQRAG